MGERMLKLFMEEHIHKPTAKGKTIQVDPSLDDSFLADVAKRTDGFSGRQLAKLVVAYQAAVFGSGTTRLTPGLAETVLKYKLANLRKMQLELRRVRQTTSEDLFFT